MQENWLFSLFPETNWEKLFWGFQIHDPWVFSKKIKTAKNFLKQKQEHKKSKKYVIVWTVMKYNSTNIEICDLHTRQICCSFGCSSSRGRGMGPSPLATVLGTPLTTYINTKAKGLPKHACLTWDGEWVGEDTISWQAKKPNFFSQ